MLRRIALAVLIAGIGLAGPIAGPARDEIARAAGSLVVTSTGDGGICPSDDDCTLRAAIETANADDTGGPFTITFDADVFSPDAPGTITVGLTPLPSVTRPATIIDASEAGVFLRYDNPSLSGSANGLIVAAPDVSVWGMDIAGFPAACLLIESERATIGGDRSLGRGNRMANCGTGIAVYGDDAAVRGNSLVRQTTGDSPSAFDIAIEIAASDASVGPSQPNDALTNHIGDANRGIVVVGSSGSPVTGTTIAHNVLGRTAAGTAAPLDVGALLDRWTSGTAFRDNVVANASVGIVVAAPSEGPNVTANRISGNAFVSLDTLAIDLAGDGSRNANDEGDGDLGPNALLNHPLITRATQSRIEGTACAACEVQVYAAFRLPGGQIDYGSTPLPAGSTTADATGAFVLDSPAVSPGEWVTALAIDAAGNTSEFGPSSRVGAGAVQCGSVQLRAGWNHLAYFGPQVVFLGDTFAADPAGSVTSIYRANDGTLSYERWFKETAVGRTLTVVEPGESYWMYATEPVSLAGGFSVSFPVPVELEAGWNDFVYIGATADVVDALAGMNGKYRDLYSFDTELGRFLRYGDPDVPGWAREFGLLTACATYQVFMLEPATLTPLQP